MLCLRPSILITCSKFDNLLPELELSISVLCVNVVSCSVKEACFRRAGTRDLIYDVVLFSWPSVEFWRLMFRCSDQILICLTRSDPTGLSACPDFSVLVLGEWRKKTATPCGSHRKFQFIFKKSGFQRTNEITLITL